MLINVGDKCPKELYDYCTKIHPGASAGCSECHNCDESFQIESDCICYHCDTLCKLMSALDENNVINEDDEHDDPWLVKPECFPIDLDILKQLMITESL